MEAETQKPKRKPRAAARLVATLALGAAFIAVLIVIASALSDTNSSDSESDNTPAEGRSVENPGGSDGGRDQSNPGERDFYVVKEGDSLSLIESRTGVTVDEILELNPKIDPQILVPGTKLRLR